MKLYVKVWCPWCIAAKGELDRRGLSYEELDVEQNGAAYREMVALSGQSRTPTLVLGDRVLANFGPDELEPFLTENGGST